MPSWFRELASRLKGSFRPSGADIELSDELQAHIEMLTEENIRRGMNCNEARRQAKLKLGNQPQINEDYRRQAGLPFLEVLRQDLRYGLRMLRKSPAFAGIAIITLALGIGANSAIFSVVNGVLLQPLPYEDPGRLINVFDAAPSRDLDNFGASPPDFRTLRERNQTLTSLSALSINFFNLTGSAQPERLRAAVVSAEYFTTLGVNPMLGRSFLPNEEQWGSHNVVILSDGFWRTHLNADPNIQGKTLTLNGERYDVVGVMPSSFYTAEAPALWAPMAFKPKDPYDSHNNYYLRLVGRLKPGVTREQARLDLNGIMTTIAQQFPENKGIGAGLQPLRDQWLGDVRLPLIILLCAVSFVLLIACVNLANLMLARSATRQKEIAIRSAMGAGRRRLIRQFITESILLSLLGGALGLGLAYLCLSLLPLAKDLLPRVQQVKLDAWVMLFTFVVSVLTGVLFGLLPAFQSSRARRLNETLKEGGRTSDSLGRNGVRSGLVVAEVALALLLLLASGLALKSFGKLMRVNRGFDPSHVLSFMVNLPDSYGRWEPDPTQLGAPPKVAAFFQANLSRIEQLPGVKAAGAVSSLPLAGENWIKFFVPLDRPVPSSMDKVPTTQYRAIAGHYFEALSIRLLKGRLLNEHDQANNTLSVVLNETLARRFWPAGDPIGKTVLLTPPESLIPPDEIPPGFHIPIFTVVGVVADAHYGSLDQAPQPLAYASVFQNDYSPSPFITVRTDGDPMAQVNSIRRELAQFDSSLPMSNIALMDEVMSQSVAQPRLEAILLGLFGALAVVLASIGIYGVMSYMATQRTSEIGIRMALGASRASVLKMMIAQGSRLAAVGLAIGLFVGVVLSFAAKRMLAKLLFGVSATDPTTFVLVAAMLAVVALLACYIPARRATKVDPMVALRHE
jgi:putative ABC transport system permease protein